MTTPPIDFSALRLTRDGSRAAFEEFCCQLARRSTNHLGGAFRRYRGDGGDGGVECVRLLSDGSVMGWQAKAFTKLGISQRRQLKKSFEGALSNYPDLIEYYVCIPMVLTGPTNRGTSSDASWWTKTEEEMREIAQLQSRVVKIELWSQFELSEKLIENDVSGALRTYWFDARLLTAEAQEKRLREVIKTAGPKYTAELSVDAPVNEALKHFGLVEGWGKTLAHIRSDLGARAAEWQGSYASDPFNPSGKPPLPKAMLSSAARLTDKLKGAEDTLGALENTAGAGLEACLRDLKEARLLAERCEAAALKSLLSAYGKDADTPHFRSYEMQFNAHFPAQCLDNARAAVASLESAADYLSGPEFNLVGSQVLLLKGPTGAGKTHAVIDTAKRRLNSGLVSLVSFGQEFGQGEPPWMKIARDNDIAATTEHEALGVIEAAAEESGYPAVVFVDGLNETTERGYWIARLRSFVAKLADYPNVRLCLTFKTSESHSILNELPEYPCFEHRGLGPLDMNTLQLFMDYYKIQLPSVPPMRSEFGNPLFLHMLCKAVADGASAKSIWGSFGETVTASLRGKNERAAGRIDYDPASALLAKAAGRIAEEMVLSGTDFLEEDAARHLVDDMLPGREFSKSLYGALLHEDVIQSAERDDGSRIVRFAFDRLGDHLLVRAAMSKGTLGPLLASGRVGLLEAAAAEAPLQDGQELCELGLVDMALAEDAMMASLCWRTFDGPSSVLETAAEHALKRDFGRAYEALLSVTDRADCPLNAEWVDRWLRRLSLPERDGLLTPYLSRSFESGGEVDRLIGWPWVPGADLLDPKVAKLWGIQLAWFTSCADRRVRDYATKALVWVLEQCPINASDLVSRFKDVDDDYVLERVLSAVYGSLLRNASLNGKAKADLKALCLLVASSTSNAAIRDYARMIASAVSPRSTQPPALVYVSQFAGPTLWVCEGQQYMKDSCMGGDFGKYQIDPWLHDFEGLSADEARKRVVLEAWALGYSQNASDWDQEVMLVHGRLRERPVWAERIGKKYQWIGLFRATGCITDRYAKKTSTWQDFELDPVYLQAGRYRDIDPSVVGVSPFSSPSEVINDGSWAEIASPTIVKDLGSAGEDGPWVKKATSFDPSVLIEASSPWGASTLVLFQHRNWAQGNRRVQLILQSYLVPAQDFESWWAKMTKTKGLRRRDMAGPLSLYGVFVGEYPRAMPAKIQLEYADQDRVAQHDSDYAVANEVGFKLGPDSSEPRSYPHMLVPSQILFGDGDLVWDGEESYVVPGEGAKFLNVRQLAPGYSNILIGDRDYLLDYCERHGLKLVWTVWTEKAVIEPGNGAKAWGEHTYIGHVKDGRLEFWRLSKGQPTSVSGRKTTAMTSA